MTIRNAIFALVVLLLGLGVFEGLPAVGFRWTDGHLGMWYFLLIVYPLVLFPVICCLVEAGDRPERRRTYGIIIALALLFPEALLIAYREFKQYAPAKLWKIGDAVVIVLLFVALACVAGIAASSMLRILRAPRNRGHIPMAK